MLKPALISLAILFLIAPGAFAQKEKALVPDPDYIVREAAFFVPYDRLDPHRIFYLDWDPIFRCIYETPLVCDRSSEVLTLEPRLLKELPTMAEDGKLMTLRFRENVRFHDDGCFEYGVGRLMTAQDFAFVLKHHIDPKSASPYYKSYLEGLIVGAREAHNKALAERVFDYEIEVPGIKVTGSHELELRFTEASPRFSALLAMTWASLIPREAWVRYGTGLAQHPVGTGPYLYDRENSRPEMLFMKPNPKYWDRDSGGDLGTLPLNAGVRFEVIEDQALRSKRFFEDDLTILDLTPTTAPDFLDHRHNLRSALRRKGFSLGRADAGSLHYVAFNMRNKLLAKPGLRRALAMALDRDEFIEDFYSGAAVPAKHIVPPSLPLGTKKPDKLEWTYGRFDLKRAKELLAEAGHPDGEGLPEFILSRWGTDELAKQETQFLKDSWEKIGVRVQIRLETTDDFLARARQGLHEISINYWTADYPDPNNFFFMLLQSSSPAVGKTQDSPNVGFWKDDRYEKLYADASKLSPGDERGRIFEEMVKIIQFDVPWIFLAHQQSNFVRAADVEGAVSRSYFSRDYSRIRKMVKPAKK